MYFTSYLSFLYEMEVLCKYWLWNETARKLSSKFCPKKKHPSHLQTEQNFFSLHQLLQIQVPSLPEVSCTCLTTRVTFTSKLQLIIYITFILSAFRVYRSALASTAFRNTILNFQGFPGVILFNWNTSSHKPLITLLTDYVSLLILRKCKLSSH